MGGGNFALKLVFLLGGLLVWAAYFGAVYAIHAVGCVLDADRTQPALDLLVAVIAAATLLGAVASGAIGYSAATGRGPGIAGESNDSVRQFWRFGTLVLAGAGLIAIVWTGATLLVIPPCL